jgi:hypothetical protein
VEPDTTPDAEAAQIAAYRRMGGTARSAIAFRLTALARRAVESGIRARHPEYDEARVRRALLRLRYGDEAARCVWLGEDLVEP